MKIVLLVYLLILVSCSKPPKDIYVNEISILPALFSGKVLIGSSYGCSACSKIVIDSLYQFEKLGIPYISIWESKNSNKKFLYHEKFQFISDSIQFDNGYRIKPSVITFKNGEIKDIYEIEL